ncbi:MAG: hypothetical protein EBX52_12395 [Proteobacteria bacterium]|nr:hypothetical protein [Pseudomonadota bacterium]
MNTLRSFCLLISTLTLFVSNARADIALTQKGQPTGYIIKVIHEGDTVGFQLFSGDLYVKNLGDKNRYPVRDLERYNASLPQQIKYDHGRRIAFHVGGAIVGVAAGVMATRLMVEANRGGGGMFSGLAAGLAALIAIGPATVIGGIGGYFGAGALDHHFFISAERNELRATLTSNAMLKNDRVVLDVDNAVEAAAELDTALSGI